jgi:asparagine synthase (glutamine-hydrolysing)
MRLEEAMRPALLRPPCLVSFSGGRDSSAVLAVAAHAARREGLALPIPVTARFAWAQSAEETAWQELVVKHLRLPDWELSLTSENTGLLDSVGPVATRGLLRHGALFPHNAHFHTPLLELARGGSLLTGIDGDGLFGSWPWWRAAAVLAGKTAPQPRDLLRVGHALAPASLRRRYSTRRHAQREAPTWLTAPAQLAFARAVTTFSEEPLRWSSHVEAFARRRELAVGSASLSLLADDADALIVHPFLDRAFLSSLKRAGGTSGWGDRTATMTALFGGLLPSSALTRTTKAIFGEVFWSEPSREFARSWDGRGVDTDLVDVEALRAEWLSPSPDGRTGLLLQSAWLHANGRSGAGA